MAFDDTQCAIQDENEMFMSFDKQSQRITWYKDPAGATLFCDWRGAVDFIEAYGVTEAFKIEYFDDECVNGS